MKIRNSGSDSGTPDRPKPTKCANCGCVLHSMVSPRTWAYAGIGTEERITAFAHGSWEECSAALAEGSDVWGKTKGCGFCFGLHHDVRDCPKLATVDG